MLSHDEGDSMWCVVSPCTAMAKVTVCSVLSHVEGNGMWCVVALCCPMTKATVCDVLSHCVVQ